MDGSDIPVKTAAGSEEVRARSRKLPPRLRTVLIMVDGQLAASQLQHAAVTLGAPDDALQTLLREGLIGLPAKAAAAVRAVDLSLAEPVFTAAAPTDADRIRATHKFMNDNAVDARGLWAYPFTLKLEKCFTCADLRALLPDFAKLIVKGNKGGNGEAVAEVLVERARQMLG